MLRCGDGALMSKATPSYIYFAAGSSVPPDVSHELASAIQISPRGALRAKRCRRLPDFVIVRCAALFAQVRSL